MSVKKRDNAALVGVGVAACAVCCAGPILGVLASIGAVTVAGFALIGAMAVVVGAMLVAFVVVRRRRRAVVCTVSELPTAVAVELASTRSRS